MKSLAKILAASLAVLGLMALSASGAQALEYRLENGTALAGETVSSSGGTATLAAAGVTITCTSHSGTGTLSAGATATNLVLTLKGCTANKLCTVPAEIKTNTLSSSSKVESGRHYIIIIATGKTFVEITFGGVECALAGKQPVTGSVCAEGPVGIYVVEQSSSTPSAGCASTLKVGANAATITASSKGKLTGANAGQKWGIV